MQAVFLLFVLLNIGIQEIVLGKGLIQDPVDTKHYLVPIQKNYLVETKQKSLAKNGDDYGLADIDYLVKKLAEEKKKLAKNGDYGLEDIDYLVKKIAQEAKRKNGDYNMNDYNANLDYLRQALALADERLNKSDSKKPKAKAVKNAKKVKKTKKSKKPKKSKKSKKPKKYKRHA